MPIVPRSEISWNLKKYDPRETPAPRYPTSTRPTIQIVRNGPSLPLDSSQGSATGHRSTTIMTPHKSGDHVRPVDWTKIHKHTRVLYLIALVRVRAGHERNSAEYNDATELLRGEAWGIANGRGLKNLDLLEKVMTNAAGSHCNPGWAALELERYKLGPMEFPFGDDLSDAKLGTDILAGTLSARLMEVGSLPAQSPRSSTARGTQPEALDIRSLARWASGSLVDRLVERIAEADTVEQIRAELEAFVHMFERGGQALPSARLPVLDLARAQIEFCDSFDEEQAGAMMRAAIADHQRELRERTTLSNRCLGGNMRLVRQPPG